MEILELNMTILNLFKWFSLRGRLKLATEQTEAEQSETKLDNYANERWEVLCLKIYSK